MSSDRLTTSKLEKDASEEPKVEVSAPSLPKSTLPYDFLMREMMASMPEPYSDNFYHEDVPL